MIQIKEELVTTYESKLLEMEEKWRQIRDSEVGDLSTLHRKTDELCLTTRSKLWNQR
jgi:hypothetical protein